MRIILFFSFLFFFFSTVTAQSPRLINYQGVARDIKGNPISLQSLSIKIEIVPTIDAANTPFAEFHLVKTNEFGLYTLQIGNGEKISGNLADIKWETGSQYIRIYIDDKGGNDFSFIGTTQLLSVPYALYADKAGVAHDLVSSPNKTRTGTVSSNATHLAADAGYLSKFTALNTIGKSVLFESGAGNIGLNTTAPAAKFHVNSTASTELVRMQCTSPTGIGKFTIYNDVVNNYATFSKYGSQVTGGFAGLSSMIPLANLLAFGNNNGSFLVSNSGTIAFSLLKNSTNYVKFVADYNSLNVGIGGSATPVTNVHINSLSTGDTLKISNATSGHTSTDGLDIRLSGNSATIMNRENAGLVLGTNNFNHLSLLANGFTGINQSTPLASLHVNSTGTNSAIFNNTGLDNTNGIIHAEYTGSTVDDHVAVYAKSVPSSSSNYGIGVYAEGGYTGSSAFAKSTSTNAVYGAQNISSSRGENYGSYNEAQTDLSGNYGTKIGVMGYAKGGQNNYGVYGDADTTGAFANTYAGYFNGDVAVTNDLFVVGNISKGGGTFKIDHPLDPENKFLYHSFVESPDMMNIYNGNIFTDAQGIAIVQLPDYFEALNADVRYQLTAIGGPAQVWIEKELSQNSFVIKSSIPNTKVSWQITGIRKDDYANAHRVQPVVEKSAADKGKYLYPVEAGKSADNGIYQSKKLKPIIRR